MRWVLILHGGAKEVSSEQEQANRRGCMAALEAGRAILDEGRSAVEAVEAVILILEDDPAFNAGFGSVLNADGEVEMDAALMDGSSFDLGGVAAIRGVRHPITVARLMLREPPTLLVGDGARCFASEHGAELCEPKDLISGQQGALATERGHDTVGCVALDCAGNIAAGASTGGLHGTLPGRVGDSPLPGCGLYADTEVGGVAFSGDGENIARMILAARVMQELATQSPQVAVERAIARLAKIGGEAGAIALDREGRIGWVHNSLHFAVAYASSGSEPRVYLHKGEERAGA